MTYDDERDRHANGFDAGAIVDGTVVFDKEKNEYVLVDDENVAFSTQSVLKTLEGKQVRITCISFEAIEEMEKLVALSEQAKN